MLQRESRAGEPVPSGSPGLKEQGFWEREQARHDGEARGPEERSRLRPQASGSPLASESGAPGGCQQ